MTPRLALAARIVVGGVLVLAGILKCLALGTPKFEGTIVHAHLSSTTGIAALAVGEVALGMAYILDLWRPIDWFVVGTLLLFSGVLLHDVLGPRPSAQCGCLVGASGLEAFAIALVRTVAMAILAAWMFVARLRHARTGPTTLCADDDART